MTQTKWGYLIVILLSVLAIECGGDGSSSQTSAAEAWGLGDVTIVARDLPGNDVTSMVSNSTDLYFSIDSGPLMQVAHADTTVTTALPQEPFMHSRYEIRLDDEGAIYWSNGLSGGGDPGQVVKTSLDTQQPIWELENLNGPERLQMRNEYIYFINDWQEVRRVSLSGTESNTIHVSENRNLKALAVSEDGKVFIGSYPNGTNASQSVISMIPEGGSLPTEIYRRDSHGIVQILIQGAFLYVLDAHIIYSLDTEDGTLRELVNGAPLHAYAPFFVDEDGIYWVGSDYRIYAAYLDGSNAILVGEGTYFCKYETLIYWYNRDGMLMRRTLAHQ